MESHAYPSSTRLAKRPAFPCPLPAYSFRPCTRNGVGGVEWVGALVFACAALGIYAAAGCCCGCRGYSVNICTLCVVRVCVCVLCVYVYMCAHIWFVDGFLRLSFRSQQRSNTSPTKTKFNARHCAPAIAKRNNVSAARQHAHSEWIKR